MAKTYRRPARGSKPFISRGIDAINGVVGHKARILVRVKASRRHLHEFRHQCAQLGILAVQVEAKLDPRQNNDNCAPLVWFDCEGRTWAIEQLNDLPLVVESQFVVNTRVPWAAQGSGPEKVRTLPIKSGFTPAANLESKHEIAMAEMAQHEANSVAWKV